MSDPDLVLTRAQIRAVDRIAIEEYGIPGVVLMENAGAGATRLLLEERPRSVGVLCGPGNNGGDGYVVARHLANAGVAVIVYEYVEPERSRGDAGIMRTIVRRMLERGVTGLACRECWSEGPDRFEDHDWIVDGLLGTGFEGEVREPLASALRAANESPARGFALDLPSGLDADTGEASGVVFQAERTATFAATKRGLRTLSARDRVGRVDVVSIGVPPELLERVRSAPSGSNRDS
jgi:NAD(P)H-hydrate epimerase